MTYERAEAMTRFVAVAIVLCLSSYSAVTFAKDGVPDGHWEHIGFTVDPPIHETLLGPLIQEGDAQLPFSKATFLIWGKAVFKEPQKLGSKTYSVEYMSIELDCPKHTFRDVRDVKYDSDDHLVSDVVFKTATRRHFDFNFTGDTGVLPLDEGFAVIAVDDTCEAE